MRSADAESKKPAPPGGHEAVKKEIKSRTELLGRLEKLESDTKALRALQESIATVTDAASAGELKENCSAFEREIARLKSQTETRIEELKELDRCWKDFSEKLLSVARWHEEEAAGRKTKDGEETRLEVNPEKQLAKAQVQKCMQVDHLGADAVLLSKFTKILLTILTR